MLKVEVKSVLRIGSAHNNVRTSNLNIAQISNVSNFSEHKLYFIFRSIANQNGVRYSDSTSYFKKYSSSKCKQTVCLHYGLDFHFNIKYLPTNLAICLLFLPQFWYLCLHVYDICTMLDAAWFPDFIVLLDS